MSMTAGSSSTARATMVLHLHVEDLSAFQSSGGFTRVRTICITWQTCSALYP